MIITRKIQVVVNATGNERKEYIHQIYSWRDLIRKAANMIVSHKFVQQNVRDFAYVQDEIIDKFLAENPGELDSNGQTKFFVKNILKKEKGNSEQNVTYRVASSYLKGKCPSALFTCLNQAVANSYKERIKDFLAGKASIPSYRNIPIPFPGNKLQDLTEVTKEYTDKESGKTKTVTTYTFNFFDIPLELFFGRDRSNNRVMIERALAGEYKFCGSSIEIDDDKKKMFLLVSLDIPVQKKELKADRTLYATLDFETPIICSTDKTLCTNPEEAKHKVYIGNEEEYLHRRIEIQAALHRCQKAAKYNKGGHGRKKKTAAIDRFHEKEKNYIESKIHLYSSLLIKEALKNKCATICLANYAAVEKAIEEDDEGVLLRNWGYYNLANKINYKAAKYGITVEMG